MTFVQFRIAAGLAVLAAAATLSACGGAGDHYDRSSSAPAAADQQGSPHNASDISFAEGMIPHHQQAIALAALVPSRSTNPAVVKIAAAISAQQDPEVTAMRALLVQWQVDPAAEPHHDMGSGEGMVDDATMARLKTLNGAAFDNLWLQSMITHHEGAIAMAKVEVAQGQSPDLIAMANNIVAVQQAEIGQLQQIMAAK